MLGILQHVHELLGILVEGVDLGQRIVARVVLIKNEIAVGVELRHEERAEQHSGDEPNVGLSRGLGAQRDFGERVFRLRPELVELLDQRGPLPIKVHHLVEGRLVCLGAFGDFGDRTFVLRPLEQFLRLFDDRLKRLDAVVHRLDRAVRLLEEEGARGELRRGKICLDPCELVALAGRLQIRGEVADATLERDECDDADGDQEGEDRRRAEADFRADLQVLQACHL